MNITADTLFPGMLEAATHKNRGHKVEMPSARDPSMPGIDTLDGLDALGVLGVIRVLLVEDDEADSRLVQSMLTSSRTAACAVRRVSLLSDAILALEFDEFDVILLDLTLPDARGTDTVRKLMAAGIQVPVVVLTGLQHEQVAIETMREGAQDYLVKGEGGAQSLRRAIRCAIERKKAERRLAYFALHDPLTGLGNRTLYQDQLEQALVRARRNRDNMAVLFLDLDRFKEVNDNLGHDVGDQLLRAVADRLRSCVRECDTLARLGGDEFAIVLEGLETPESAGAIAHKALSVLQQPFSLNGHALIVTPSIGVAVCPDGGTDAETLTKNADTAMYEVKEQGRNAYRIYTGEMDEAVVRRISIEEGLRIALKAQALSLHFQPRIDLGTGVITGAAAFPHWHSPELGTVPSEEFVPVAEQSGLIGALGEWVLRAACDCHKDWQRAGLPPTRLTLKLSSRQFQHSDIGRVLTEALDASGTPAGTLTLEVEESVLAGDTGGAVSQLDELRARGATIVLDRFAAGATSLQELRRWPIDAVNLDRSYIQEVDVQSNGGEVAAAVIGLASALEYDVVVSAVETDAQVEFARAHGANEVQGRLFGPPVPAERFAALLEQGAKHSLLAPQAVT